MVFDPYQIRSFLPLWVIGTTVRATTCVDMKYTRKTGVVRIQVAILEVEHIPEEADIVVDDNICEIFFDIDHVIRADEDNIDDADDLDDEGDQQGEDKGDEDHVMEEAHNAESGKTNSKGPEKINNSESSNQKLTEMMYAEAINVSAKETSTEGHGMNFGVGALNIQLPAANAQDEPPIIGQ